MISQLIEMHSCKSRYNKDMEEMEEDTTELKCLVCRLPSNLIRNEGQPGTSTPPASRSHVLGIEVCATTQSIQHVGGACALRTLFHKPTAILMTHF